MMTPRRNFPRPVRREIIERATNKRGEIFCEGCGLVLAGKPWEIDHIIPDNLLPYWKKDKKLTANEGQLLGLDCCHRGPDGKTKKDVARISKAKRQLDKSTGAMRPKAKIKSAGFASSEKVRKIDRSVLPELPRRSLFK